MFGVDFIAHNKFSESILLEVIRLKSLAWNYPFAKQMSWINENIKDSDLHCVLSKNGVNVAYLNLIVTDVFIDDVCYKAYGIGNVCSSIRGKGYGSVIMGFVNDFIVDKNRIGLLLCKPPLTCFYNKADWMLIPHSKLHCSFDLTEIEMMIYNCKTVYKKIDYKGSSF